MITAAAPVGCERIEAFMNPQGKKEPAEPPPLEVVVAPVARRDVEKITEWVGTVDGSVNAQIRARVSGYLLKQHYADGAFVKTGDLLFEIDPRPFEAALADARAQLAKAHAEQTKSATDVARLTPLVEKRAVSRQELDDAHAADAANLAQIEAAKAAIQIAELNLAFTKIYAPIDGIAGKANIQLGDLVDPLSAALTVISTMDPANVYIFVTERDYLAASDHLMHVADVPLVERNEAFEIILADGSSHARRGRYFFTDREVGSGTGSMRAVLRVENPGNVLRPGQFALVRAATKSIPGALLVPQRAVREVQGSFEIAVVSAENVVEIRQVKPGLRDGSDWVIDEGIQFDERVVIEGIQKVRTGTKVAPRTAGSGS